MTIVHPALADQPFEISAFIKRNGRQLEAKFVNCHACPHRADTTESRPWRVGELKYIRTTDLVADTLQLVPHLPDDLSAVVGIPRSGLLPATVLATTLKLPLYSLDPEKGPLEVGAGYCRGRTLENRRGTILVIDDTVYDGRAMERARQQAGDSGVVFAAIYARKTECLDLFARRLESPHLCEWNIFQNPVMSGQAADKRLRGGICFDFDGIFCPNPPGPVTDEWLRNVPALHYLPKASPIPMIVSMRLEGWRRQSLEWLHNHGAACERMILANYESEAARDADYGRALINTKVMPFAESDCWLMVESEPEQAELIADISEKPVLCPSDGRIYY